MFREKLIDKRHLRQMQEEAFEFEERIERGEIDAKKTAEDFYKESLNIRILVEIVAFIFIALSVLMLRAGWSFTSGLLLVPGIALLILNTPEFLAPRFRLFFKGSEEEKVTR